mmetsp:Transcript_10117/g.8866  ORF Transcript_10117/g.8866 Transcript_10117/m.8866 type:complete len:256 (+) Transcript_10117:2623-3390(+)
MLALTLFVSSLSTLVTMSPQLASVMISFAMNCSTITFLASSLSIVFKRACFISSGLSPSASKAALSAIDAIKAGSHDRRADIADFNKLGSSAVSASLIHVFKNTGFLVIPAAEAIFALSSRATESIILVFRLVEMFSFALSLVKAVVIPLLMQSSNACFSSADMSSSTLSKAAAASSGLFNSSAILVSRRVSISPAAAAPVSPAIAAFKVAASPGLADVNEAANRGFFIASANDLIRASFPRDSIAVLIDENNAS